MAFKVRVGAVQKQRMDAELGEPFKLLEVLDCVFLVVIKPEIGKVHHDTGGRVERDASGVGHGMAYTEKFRGKMFGKFYGVVIFNFYEVHLRNVGRFAYTFLNYFSDQSRAIDGRITEPFQNVGNRAEVVIVPVGYQKSSDIFLFFLKITRVRDNPIHAWSFFFGELYAHVNDYNFIVVFKKRAVAADFFQSSQGNIVNRVVLQGRGVAVRFVACKRPFFAKFALRSGGAARNRPCAVQSSNSSSLMMFLSWRHIR